MQNTSFKKKQKAPNTIFLYFFGPASDLKNGVVYSLPIAAASLIYLEPEKPKLCFIAWWGGVSLYAKKSLGFKKTKPPNAPEPEKIPLPFFEKMRPKGGFTPWARQGWKMYFIT